MAKYGPQMIGIFERYSQEIDPDPTDLAPVAEWAVANGLYHPIRVMLRGYVVKTSPKVFDSTSAWIPKEESTGLNAQLDRTSAGFS